MKIFQAFRVLRCIIDDPLTLINSRFSEKHFTRNRKMPFCDVLRFFFDMKKTTLQTRLNDFFKGTSKNMSEQAFSKARNLFDHSPFETMVRELVKEEYSNPNHLPKWNGYHLLAVDGSYLQLPKNQKLKEAFGTRGNDDCVSAGISVLYDLLTGWAIDPAITHSDMNERKECDKHIDYLSRELPHRRS